MGAFSLILEETGKIVGTSVGDIKADIQTGCSLHDLEPCIQLRQVQRQRVDSDTVFGSQLGPQRL